jgi:hypothetical protein
MAKAVFHRGQRVYVKSVGTWAHIEKIAPQWVKGVEEPLRILYDVGLGRDFQASELAAEAKEDRTGVTEHEHWRILRMRNRMALEGAETNQPFPGTFPVVVTEEQDWGGWRVPAAEYDRDPDRIEFQARVIVNALKMLRLTKELVRITEGREERLAPEVREIVKDARGVLRSVYEPIKAQQVAAE